MTSCSTNVCGVGGWGGPLPGDPDSTNVVLSATPAFGGIDVSWTYPAVYPEAVAHVRLYRSNSADFGGALLHHIVTGTFFYDKVDADIQYWYWIEIVSVNGTVSPLIGPATATAKPLIEEMIERLTAQIDAGLLATTLRAKLDEISMINDNLLAEIMARENSEISLADAIALAQTGNAEALTFITNIRDSLVSADSAIAENIELVAATLGDDFAAVTTAMQVNIDATQGTVDALYTAKVTVNGLVGGFGIWNNSVLVEAGFDVDRFWIGRTSADKRKPFIVDGGVVYIDEAAINKLTFSKLRDESGSFIVSGGRVQANYLTVNEASIQNLSVSRAKIQDAAIGSAQIEDASIGRAKIGTAAIGSAQIGDLEVGTLKIAGEAVTMAKWGVGNPTATATFITDVGAEAVNTATWGPGPDSFTQYSATFSLTGATNITIVSEQYKTETVGDSSVPVYRSPPISMASVSGHGAGSNTITASASMGADCIVTTLVRKR